MYAVARQMKRSRSGYSDGGRARHASSSSSSSSSLQLPLTAPLGIGGERTEQMQGEAGKEPQEVAGSPSTGKVSRVGTRNPRWERRPRASFIYPPYILI